MNCRQCGTRIADKALICYKCGTATTEAKYAPVPISGRPSLVSVAILVALAILVFLGIYTGATGETETTRMAGWVATAAAVLLAAVVLLRRRR
jgi:uncharacterized protein (TIGR03382 family)